MHTLDGLCTIVHCGILSGYLADLHGPADFIRQCLLRERYVIKFFAQQMGQNGSGEEIKEDVATFKSLAHTQELADVLLIQELKVGPKEQHCYGSG